MARRHHRPAHVARTSAPPVATVRTAGRGRPTRPRLPLAGAQRFVAGGAYVALVAAIVGALALLFGARGLTPRDDAAVSASDPLASQASPAALPATARDAVIATGYHWVFDGERTDRTPQLSPDGRYAAWLPYVEWGKSGATRLIVRDLDSGVERDLTPEDGFNYSGVRWSPDSRALAFVKYRQEEGGVNPAELWRIDADGGNLRLLYRDDNTGGAPGARGPSLRVGEWSPDGATIGLGGTIWGGPAGSSAGLRVRADGSGETETPSDLSAVDCGLAKGKQTPPNQYLAPDGSYALCWVQTADLLVRPADAAATVDERGQSLVLREFATGRTRVLVSDRGGTFRGFSPDGGWIAFTTGSSPSADRSARFGVVRRDGTGRHDFNATSISWLAGDRLYFTASPPAADGATRTLYALDLASGATRPVVPDWPETGVLSASSDGRRVLTIRSASDAPLSGLWSDGAIHLVEVPPPGAR